MKKKPVFLKRYDPASKDPVPKKSSVAFRKPLSAHERVMRAIRTHEIIKRQDSEPGDESFDTPIDKMDTPHQLVSDPETGKEMTAGEYVMLQHERSQARQDVESVRQKREAAAFARAARKKIKKADDSKLSSAEATEDDDGEAAD